jgi:uncharacterized membrane protein YsdA (DUF1294 family)
MHRQVFVFSLISLLPTGACYTRAGQVNWPGILVDSWLEEILGDGRFVGRLYGGTMSSIYVRYAVLGLGASVVLFLLLNFQTSWWWYWNWLLAASVVTFVMYGLDKTQAKRDGGRIPNAILHMMALIGGFVGALFGRIVFNHKSNVRSNPLFLITLILGFVISGAFIYWQLFLK